MKKISILLLFLWMGIIFLFSCENGTKSRERSINVTFTGLNTIKEVIGSNKEADNKEMIKEKTPSKKTFRKNDKIEIESHLFWIRKGAHLFEYLILGILALHFISTCQKRISLKAVFFSILLCVLYACSDEIHQLFVPGRTGRIFDVFVDFIGITVGCLVYCLVTNYIIKRRFTVQGGYDEKTQEISF